MAAIDEGTLGGLGIPDTLRARATEIIEVTDEACVAHLDGEYAELCRALVSRLASECPESLGRGGVRIWAAGVIYAVGRVNFLFDRSQDPHLSADDLAHRLGVAKTTMANKAATITKSLGLGIYEPDLMRTAMTEQHPLTWMIAVDGLPVDARGLPPEIQEQARRQGLIPAIGRAS